MCTQSPRQFLWAKNVASHFGWLRAGIILPEMPHWMLRGMHLSHLDWIMPNSREHDWQKKTPKERREHFSQQLTWLMGKTRDLPSSFQQSLSEQFVKALCNSAYSTEEIMLSVTNKYKPQCPNQPAKAYVNTMVSNTDSPALLWWVSVGCEQGDHRRCWLAVRSLWGSAGPGSCSLSLLFQPQLESIVGQDPALGFEYSCLPSSFLTFHVIIFLFFFLNRCTQKDDFQKI